MKRTRSKNTRKKCCRHFAPADRRSGSFYLPMEPIIKGAIPVLPAADTAESLKWWTEVCGFKETFRDATPPVYAGINRGEAYLHIADMSDKALARKIGDQTMVRIAVENIETLYAEYQKRGGKVHPNGALQTKPWGTKEFGAIDPNGVCVTFQERRLLSLIAVAFAYCSPIRF